MISYSNIKPILSKLAIKRLQEGVCVEDLEHICALCPFHRKCADHDHQICFEEMKESGFFSDKSEEDEFKGLPSKTKTFFYLEFKKLEPYITK